MDTINISDEESNASNSEGGNSDDEGKNGGATRKPNATQSQPAKKLKSASTVVEKKVKPSSQKGVTAPRHKRKASSPANISNEAAEFFSSNVEFLKATVHSDTERLKLLKSHEIREENQHNFMVEKERAEMTRAEREAKVKNAREIVTMDGMPEEVKAAARQVLLDYFSIAGQ